MGIKFDYVLGKLRESDTGGGGGGGTDANAVHVNAAGEINGITAKATPTSSDLLIIEDAADSNNKKKITIGNLPATSDANAVHVNAANEITAITEKTTVDNQDEFIIEDSGDSGNKKSIKRKNIVRPIVNSTTTTATLTPNIDEYEQEDVTDLASAMTIAAPTGTPSTGMKLIFRITDDGTARALTWNVIYRAIGVTIPTTTTANKILYVGCIYDEAGSKWDVVAVKEEA